MEKRGKKTRYYIFWGVGVLVLIVGSFTVGYLSGNSGEEKGQPHKDPSQETGLHEKESIERVEYTCSMHPQIRQPGPGKCPICYMDLIPVTADEGGSLREYAPPESAKELARIEVSRVERKYVTAEVRLVGKVKYDETRLAYITAYFPGRLERLFVDYTGIPVQKGDHMATIYSPDLFSAEEELLQALKAASDLEDSEIEEVREAAGMTAEAAAEKLRLWGLTEDQIREIGKRGKPSDRETIYSPMGGIVVHKDAVEGMYVKTGTRIYTIADLSRVWVILDAYESDLQWLRYGQKLTFTTEAHPGETFEGKIIFIDPVLDPKTRTVKVRVNVPNDDGRLKPDMFVRAIVRSMVAAGGKVIEPELVGKWISPMHPEIIKDGPGFCDICEMPLVRAEDLGYAAASEKDSAEPLVIPATAPLLTGKRAVVYVQLPDKEKPTYEGREVVLGPRAGDYYIIRSGLEESELVVTNGAFKIDSALQLLAKPSMMTPESGMAGRAHAHGTHEMEKDKAGPTAVEVPGSFLNQLKKIESAYEKVSDAAESDETSLVEVTSAFVELEEAVDSVDASLLLGEAKVMWKELRMLLKNDAVEGRHVKNAKEARETLELLDRHMAMMRTSFGMVMAAAMKFDVPAESKNQLEGLVKAYISVQAALASDDAGEATRAAVKMRDALSAVDMALLDHEAHMAWMNELEKLNGPLERMSSVSDIQKIREHFALVSDEIPVMVEMFGVAGKKPLYRIKCPMAFGNRGATWLQTDKDVRNPYFGASMLKCGEIIDEIAGQDAGNTEGHRHE